MSMYIYEITSNSFRTNGDNKVKTASAVDTSPIANKKSRKRKILDDSDEEDATESTLATNSTDSSSPPSSSNITATVSDDLPCSSASLQQSPNILNTPPKRLTGNMHVCTCVSVCACVYACMQC